MTYRELIDILFRECPDRLDDTVIVEGGPYGLECNEIRTAELRICDVNHSRLNDGDPVIYIST